MAEMLGAHDPFKMQPDAFLTPTLAVGDEAPENKGKTREPLDPVAARRALNFCLSVVGMLFVFVGSSFLWNWQVACLIIGTYLLLRAAIPAKNNNKE